MQRHQGTLADLSPDTSQCTASPVDARHDALTLRTESQIVERWHDDVSRPWVSILCATYNHAGFIEDALRGFLIQETDFPFEIIVHDDASTDGTADVVRQYQERYPNIVKAILQHENQYSQGIRVGQRMLKLAVGKYVAICEGDDYWQDPRKLQIQVDFLQTHPDYVVSGHDAIEVDVQGGLVKKSRLPDRYKMDFDSLDLVHGRVQIANLTRVFRNVLPTDVFERRMVGNGDAFTLSLLGLHGKSKYHGEIQPAVYRKHPGGVWSTLTPAEREDQKLNTFYWIYRYYRRIGKHQYADYYWNRMLDVAFVRSGILSLTRHLVKRLFTRGKA